MPPRGKRSITPAAGLVSKCNGSGIPVCRPFTVNPLEHVCTWNYHVPIRANRKTMPTQLPPIRTRNCSRPSTGICVSHYSLAVW